MVVLFRRYSPQILIILCFLIACIPFWPFQVDDAYISFVYARNWIQGHGLTYNGLIVEGYSNFLWTIIIAGFLRLNADPILAARVFSLICGAISLFVIHKLNTRLNSGLGKFTAILPILSVGLSAPFLMWVVGGLETIFFTCLVLLSIYYEVTDGPYHQYLSVLFALAVALTRPEGLMLFPIFLALRWWTKRSSITSWLVSALLFLLPYGVYIFWRYSTYGYLIPNTAYLKLDPTLDTTRLAIEYLIGYLLLRPIFSGLLIAGLIVVGKNWRSNDTIWLYCSTIILAFIGFILFSGRDWMPQHRFLVPVIPLFGLYIGKLLDNVKNKKVLIAFKMLLIVNLLVEVSLSLFLYRPLAVEFGHYMDGLIQAGKWIETTTAPDATIAVVDAGALAYFSERRTIDILGLNNEHIAHSIEKSDPVYVLMQAPVLIQLHIAFSPTGELLEPIEQDSTQELLNHYTFKECYSPDIDRPVDSFYPYMFIRSGTCPK